MEKEKWLKAIYCTKEELIEWLNEMYEDEKVYEEIILKYEKMTNATIRDTKKTRINKRTMQEEVHNVKEVDNGVFKYFRR